MEHICAARGEERGDFIVKHFHVHLLVAHDGERSGLNLMAIPRIEMTSSDQCRVNMTLNNQWRNQKL